MRVHGRRQRHAEQAPGLDRCGAHAFHEQDQRGQLPEHQLGVAARVLGEPDVVVGEGQQGRGHQRLPGPQRRPRQPPQGPDPGHAKGHGRQAQRPGLLAEQHDAQLGLQAVEQVVVERGVVADQVAHRLAHEVHQRHDLVEPQGRVQLVEPQRQRQGHQGDQGPPLPPLQFQLAPPASPPSPWVSGWG